MRKSCETTLKSLGLDYLDLYLVHVPVAMHGKDGNNYELLNPDNVVNESVLIEDTWKVGYAIS